MARFTERARKLAQELQAAGTVAAIQRAPDRAAALAGLRAKVNDQVISGLINLSFAARRDGDLAVARTWAELAVEASLLGGTGYGRADALGQLVMLATAEAKREGTITAARLAAAESAAREAIALYTDARETDERVVVQLSVARLREVLGDPFGAFEAQLSAGALAVDSADPEIRAMVFPMLCPLYWDLPAERRRAGAESLVRDIAALLDLASEPGTRAGLLDAAGDAYQELDSPGGDAAFSAWSQAAAIYHGLSAAPDEYLVRARMFRYAAELGEAELAGELGEACVAAAPPDTSPSRLADDCHLLGATYRLLDRHDDAVAAYRQSIRLYLSYPEGSGAASTLYLELGMIEADADRFEAARRDLESVTSGGISGFWLRAITLADICHHHLGDLSGAITHAQDALQYAIDGLGDTFCRAYSLHQEALIRASAGDMETAYRRLSQLMQFLKRHQPTEPIIVHVSPLYASTVPLPSRAECAGLAAQVAESTGRHEEARAYRQMQADLAGEDPVGILPPDIATDPEPDLMATLGAARELRRAKSLAPTRPQEALEALALARGSYPATPEPYFTAAAHHIEGRCHLRLHDFPAAAAAFGRALAALPPGAAAGLRIDCHSGIAVIAMAGGRHAEAHAHLRACIDLIEGYRSSLPGAEDRMTFLRRQLPVYELLVTCCIALGLRAEAFSAVQKMKSRSFADLLAQSVHRPIDYGLEGQAALLRTGREDWVTEYLWNTPEHDFDSPEEYQSSREYQMLTSSIERADREKELAGERHARGLFRELQEQAADLDFAAVKRLLDL